MTVNEVDYFNGRADDHRSVTDYLSPSNHLLMQWQLHQHNGDNKRKHKKYFIELICRKYQIF